MIKIYKVQSIQNPIGFSSQKNKNLENSFLGFYEQSARCERTDIDE